MQPALTVPSPGLITPQPYDPLTIILAPNIPNKIGRNLLFSSFASILIVSLIVFISNIESSSDLTIFIIFLISYFEVIDAIVLDPKIFFWIVASTSDIFADNSNGIKTLLAFG